MLTHPIAKKKAPAKKTVVDSAVSAFDFKADEVPLKNLLLDPNNYRFWDHKKFKKKVNNRFHEEKVQAATLENLEHNYQLEELKSSILANGYVPMERIIVTPYPSKAGSYVVVEGNRRVAALKSILKESAEGVIQLSKNQIASFSKIPCAILSSKGKDLRHAERVIMGIRHIAGPKEWGAYQQALLVSELKDEEGLEFKDIGGMLGVSSVEAARRYKAVSALKCMEDDELYGAKSEPNFYRLFHEMVSSPDVRLRFGWSHEENTFTDIERARQFFQLITSDGKNEPKLTTFGDVRRLRLIVGNAVAVETLLDPDKTLLEAIRIAEEKNVSSTPSGILDETKRALARISVSTAMDLSSEDIEKIDEILATLTGFKSLAKAKVKK